MKKLFLLSMMLLSLAACKKSSTEIASLKDQVSSLQHQNELLSSENANLKKQSKILKSPKNNRPGSDKHIITIFKNLKTKKYFIKDSFGDGSSDIEEARLLNHKGLKRYEAINNEHNEYCIVEKNGDLSMWSQNGKFATFSNY